MSDLHVVVVSDHHELAQFVRERFGGAARITVLPGMRRRLPKLSAREGAALFLVETLHASGAGLAKLLRAAHNGVVPYVVLGTASQLMRSCDRLRAVMLDGAQEAAAAAAVHAPDKLPRHAGLELSLGDFMERKFHEFVRKIRLSGGKNLLRLLRHEFEKPLITLTLKETKGNQLQAAELLGMNRNTLRKKIKELKITVKR